MVLAGAPRSVTDKLQRVLNAAAHLVSGTREYDRGVSRLLHADLHWFEMADRVRSLRYKLAVAVHRCLHNKAPQYLTDCCVAVSDIAGRQRLHSAHRHQLDVPCYRRTTLGRRAFSVAAPTVWNSLPVELRDETENTFRQSLKTLLFRQYYCAQRVGGFYDNALCKSTFYLLTYLLVNLVKFPQAIYIRLHEQTLVYVGLFTYARTHSYFSITDNLQTECLRRFVSFQLREIGACTVKSPSPVFPWRDVHIVTLQAFS